MKPFEEAPEFIKSDSRQFRLFSPISKEQMHNKHAALFPPSLVAGKSILDLGCCVGATGHWCLNFKATQYTGVEVQTTYADQARLLLEKYHPGKAVIEAASVEKWLAFNKKCYDIVVLLGMLYVFVDYYSVLSNVSKIAREVIAVENLYPDLSKFDNDFCGVEFCQSQKINLAHNASLLGRGARISPSGMRFLMLGLGFESREGILLPKRIRESKDLFNTLDTPYNMRYLMRFMRTKRKLPSLSKDLSGEQRGEKIPW